ncbi:hypothetical protein QMK33_06235 [Hymenobacter sp. H14-R3]|uniref:hypothetical protein n=1 Tax=Hymenobacter sp. H14-R3 TaxID=3046308 RepID=UPI0024BA5905|nr:hypothetical protein [Hymenobacter sp. H14-R3]MDJ0364744.1 hypothetical protein [Hymenobacter sp. H14-R3]
MQFRQSQVTRSTEFVLREHGLYVSQRDGRGQLDMAVEIPYEEVLPLRLEYHSNLPGRHLRWLAIGTLWLIGNAARLQYAGHKELPEDFWFYVLSGVAALGLVVLYAWHNWWHQAIVHTAPLRVLLADHPRDRRQLRAFVQHLESHTKAYLRREYAPINPLGLIEPQLRRLGWLHELDVLSTPEAQALATRLTGRLPGRGFKSMGQKLEALYVN